MPTYLYKCHTHGVQEVIKPMAEAAERAYCPHCVGSWKRLQLPDDWQQFTPAVGIMRRVWSVPSLIVRPHGYHLRPDEPGYWNIDRAAEVSRIPSPDAKSNLGAGAPDDAELEADEYAGVPIPQPTDEGMQKLYEVARATFSDSGSRL